MAGGKKVLVIDDDPDVRGFCRALLEAEGYIVKMAATGEGGLAMAEAEKPDLIILDIMMERIDAGFRVAKQLGAKYPIIMSSSATNPSDQIFDPNDLPIRALLNKPIDGKILMDTIHRILSA